MMGMRPIADVQYGDFLFCAMDQIANQIAKLRYMSGGQVQLPLVIRAPVGATGRGAQHAQCLEPYFLSLPGIKMVAPATAFDAVGLLKSAVRDNDPVMIFEHKLLYGSKGPRRENGMLEVSSEIPEEEYTIPIGKGIVRREGEDVTIIAHLLMMHHSLTAAGRLEEEGISCEVIDLRTLWPLDRELIFSSLRKTGRVVIVEESPKQGGVGAEISAQIAESIPDYLLAPIARVAAPNTPAPFSPVMERYYVPQPTRIIEVVREMMRTY